MNVSSSSRLPEMPSSLPSRRREAKALSISIKAAAVAISRLIMLKARPMARILANTADVISPSGSMI